MDRDRLGRIGRAIVHEVRVEKIPFVAGSLAYHAFVSLLPLFALLFYVAAGLGDQNLDRGLVLLSQAVFTDGAQEVLVAEMRDASRSTGLSILGLGVLVWGTLRIFRGLDTAFSDIYETEGDNGFLDQIRDGALVLGTFALAIFVSVLIYRALPTGGPLAFLRPLVLVVGLTVTLLPMYYVFPDTDVTLKEILPGSVLASLGLTAFHTVFQLYLQSGEQNVFGGILLLLTWLYAGGLVILVGVVVNAVLSNRSTDVVIVPVFGGIDPVNGDDAWTRTELDHALSTLSDRISPRTPFSISVADDSVSLPPPSRFEVGTDDHPSLTVRWTPKETVFLGTDVDDVPGEVGDATGATTGDDEPAVAE